MTACVGPDLYPGGSRSGGEEPTDLPWMPHRLDNRALYTIPLTRLGHDPRARTYMARRTAEGRTRREIIRSLKRYISRELFRLLTATQPRPSAT